jgi:predicted metal-dependent hydrolase
MQLGLPFAPSTQHSALSTEHPAPSTQHPAPSTWRDDITFVRHPRARRYVIRIAADGGIRVTVPRGGSKREARAFAEQQRPWIDKQRRKLALERSYPGRTIDPAVESKLRDRAKLELPARLLELAAENKLRVARVSVRNQQWRWGSCAPNGHICLNWRLVQMPPEIRDYVMIHELMHLKRMDHSSRFWRLVALSCPNYQDARRWLREHARNGTPLSLD